MYPVDVNNPATWKFIAGVGNTGGRTLTPLQNAQPVIALGVNGAYIPTKIDAWRWTWVRPTTGLTDANYILNYADAIRAAGGVIFAQMYPADAWGMDQDWTNQALQQRECINNLVVGGVNQQNEYIQWAKDAVGGCLDANGVAVRGMHPEICQIMNEVRSDDFPGYTPSASYWANYITFCGRFMSEIDAINHDYWLTQGMNKHTVFTVSSIDFPNLDNIANHTAELDAVTPQGCALVYDYHYYYSLHNYAPSSVNEPANYAYWTATTQAALATAREMQYQYWDSRMDLLLSKGKRIMFDEQGTNPNNPNFATWMADAISYCWSRGIGTSYLCNTYPNGTGFNSSPAAFFGRPDLDGNVNSTVPNILATTWKQIMDSLAGGVTLPFHDSFASLANWQTINGTWSV